MIDCRQRESDFLGKWFNILFAVFAAWLSPDPPSLALKLDVNLVLVFS